MFKLNKRGEMQSKNCSFKLFIAASKKKVSHKDAQFVVGQETLFDMSTMASGQIQSTTLSLQDPKSYFKKVRIESEWIITPTNKNVDADSELSQSQFSFRGSDIGESSKFDIDMDLKMGAIEEENYDEDDNEDNQMNF